MDYTVAGYNPRYHSQAENVSLWAKYRQFSSYDRRAQPLIFATFQQFLQQGYAWVGRDKNDNIIAIAFLILLYKPGTEDIFGSISNVAIDKKYYKKKVKVSVKHAFYKSVHSSLPEVILQEIVHYAKESLCTHMELAEYISAPDKEPVDVKIYQDLGLKLTQEESGNYRLDFPLKKRERAFRPIPKMPF